MCQSTIPTIKPIVLRVGRVLLKMMISPSTPRFTMTNLEFAHIRKKQLEPLIKCSGEHAEACRGVSWWFAVQGLHSDANAHGDAGVDMHTCSRRV